MKKYKPLLPVYMTILLLAFSLHGCFNESKTASSGKVQVFESAQSLPGSISSVIDSIHLEISNGDYGLIDRFMVLHKGKLLADHRYDQDYETIAQQYDTTDHQYNYDHPDWHPYYRNTDLHTLQSVTKSITSILLGIAFDENEEYNDRTKVMPLFRDYTEDTQDKRKQDITIEDLLTMRAGIQWDEASYDEADNDCILMEASDEWIQFVLDKPSDTTPGTAFEYNSGASVLLGKIVSIITGKRIDQWAEEKLFGPLGIRDYYWKETPGGEIDTEGGLYLSSEDLMKIGLLYLNKGKWEGTQIVSESWVAKSISPIVNDVNPANSSKVGYGYQWWVPKHSNGQTEIFAGNGYGGQFLMVALEHDLIVLFNGWNIHDRANKSSWRALQDRIIPAINTE